MAITEFIFMKLFLLVAVLMAALLAVFSVAAAPSDIRINSGAGIFTDSSGDVWRADQFFTGGSTFSNSNNIQNTPDDPLYRSERFGNFVYNIPIANGNYGVELRFAEIFFFKPSFPGPRIFNVSIEGSPVLVNFNILDETSNNAALSKFFNTTVSDGSLQLRFATIADNAKISAIRIYNLSGSPPPNASGIVRLYQEPGQITLLGAGPVGTIRSTNVNIPDDVSTAISAELRYDGYDIDAAAECLVRVNGNTWLNCGPNYTDNTYTADKNALTPVWLITGSNLVEYQFASNLGGLTGGFNVKNITLAVTFPDGSAPPPPPPPPPPPSNSSSVYRINSGGPAFTDTSGNAWRADQFFTGGTTFANANNIQNTQDDTLYRSERFGNFVYNLPIVNGNYGVELRFAEIFFNPSFPGPRIFNVSIEGAPALVNFNILDVTNNNAALSRFFNTTVNDGSLQLRFATIADNAKISAIRIYTLSDSPPPPPAPPTNVSVVYRLNAGGPAFTDVFGNSWSADSPFANTGNTFVISSPIKRTDLDTMFQSERYDVSAAPELSYALPVPNGQYEIVLHFAEIYSGTSLPGQRIFDTLVEGQLAIDNLDIAGFVGPTAAYSFLTTKNITDGAINIALLHGVENPKISGIEIVGTTGTAQLFKNVSSMDFGTVTAPEHESGNFSFLIKNIGTRTLVANLVINGSEASSFKFYGPSSIILSPNEGLTVLAQFEPQIDGDNMAQLFLQSNDPAGSQIIVLHGHHLGMGGDEAHPVVVATPGSMADNDGDGFATVELDGTASHTHDGTIDAMAWYVNGLFASDLFKYNQSLPVGNNEIELFIFDEMGNNMSASITIPIYPINFVPGLLLYYYNFNGTQLTSVPATLVDINASRGFITDSLNPPGGFPPYSSQFATRASGLLQVIQGGDYTFGLSSANHSRLLIDGITLINNNGSATQIEKTGALALTVGNHSIVVEHFANSQANLTLRWQAPGSSLQFIPPEAFYHSNANVKLVINDLSLGSGPISGGNTILIRGLGYTADIDQTSVKFGSSSAQIIQIYDTNITVMTPAHAAGNVPVTVQTPQGISNAVQFTYSGSAPDPINWNSRMIRNISNPSSVAFGPDERLYVATSDGIIEALTLNGNGDVIAVQNITAIRDLGLFPNTFGSRFYRAILGLGFSPLEGPDNFAIYVSHSPLYTPENFPGKVSILRKSTNFSFVEDLVTGLPVSDHDHAVNGLKFLDNGNLLVAVGGNTDGGVPHTTFGNRDETPLSSAILEINLSKPGFNGSITYDQTVDLHVANQVSGDVSVFVSGMRNPYRVELHTNGNLYGTDNGPGFSNGVASIDCNTNASQAFNNMVTPDELNLLVRGRYYGHPNRNRGRFDTRQCTYWNSSQPDLQPQHTAPISIMSASTDGILEYRSNTFGGQLRGDLILSKLKGNVQRVVLSADGRSVLSHTELYSNGGLDVAEGPDGSLFFARHPSGDVGPPNNNVEQLKPVESPDARITSVFPNRGPLGGGNSVLITGIGFIPNAGLTSVKFNGNSCAITSISSTQIRCVMPAGTAGNSDLAIVNSGITRSLSLAYRYMTV